MINFTTNNLTKSSSPYLQQHKNNPIHWQEWSKEVLDYAKKENRLLFVSVGYATCHWCHVMAAEGFENKEIAAFLNDHFVAIKVDREQRPDIDQYMMAFLIQQQGHGGWPLNVILTPDQKPIIAMTYVPVTPKYGMLGLLDILKYAKHFYETNQGTIEQFSPELSAYTVPVREKEIIETLLTSFDPETGSFSHGPQFPPHNTLLFLLAYYQETREQRIKEMLEKILDVIATRGLHDHLQGGFYRYCVDQQWTIPHFEKMLYDQAMLLWVYSLVYKILAKEAYKTVAENIMQCLAETFEENNCYYSGHDADTNHQEGLTYLWTTEELQKVFTAEEYGEFFSIYEVSKNFGGKIHLVKKKFVFLPKIEQKLLEIRKKRAQPFVDKKIMTSWNALVGIGFLHAWRCLGNRTALQKAEALFSALLEKHYLDGKLVHSSLGNVLQSEEFLEDYATLLLFATYIYEEKHDKKMKTIITELLAKVQSFYHDHWVESRNPDFVEVPAQDYDHPTPSSISLAEFAVFRATLILGKEYEPVVYKVPLAHDFFNLQNFFRSGYLHIIHSPEKISWDKLPANCMQIIDKNAQNIQDCYKGRCIEFSPE